MLTTVVRLSCVSGWYVRCKPGRKMCFSFAGMKQNLRSCQIHVYRPLESLALFCVTYDRDTKSQDIRFVTLQNPKYPIYTRSTPNWSRLKLRYQRRWGQSWWWKWISRWFHHFTPTSDIPIKVAICSRETFRPSSRRCSAAISSVSGGLEINTTSRTLSQGIWVTSQKIMSNQFSSSNTCPWLLCLRQHQLDRMTVMNIRNFEHLAALFILIFKPKFVP